MLAVAVVIAFARSGGSDRAERPVAASDRFGQHYDGLESRRTAASVSTMAAPTSNAHTHQKLAVWVDGRRVTVPADIGVDPLRPPGDMASLHTHTDDGMIHNEGQAKPTLAMLFAVWGVPFGEDRLGPYRAGDGKVVQMWVDGKPSKAWGSLPLTDGQDIVVSYGARRTQPPVT